MTVALPADIAAGTREAVIVNWSNNAIKLLFPSARDGSTDPSEGFFDTAADGQAAIDQRGALIGVIRRRFKAVVADVLWFDPSQGLPAVTLVDAEQSAIGTFMIGRAEVDLEAETTTLDLFG